MTDAAVCIVVDSSSCLADQWHTVITSYISYLLTRLHEGRSNDSFFIAVVTYATPDYYPNPILAKRYFAAPSDVTKELKEDAHLKLGVGRTGSVSKAGMAALEGYAAALEMFDLFLSSHRSAKEPPQDKQPAEGQTVPLCHIIHISACPPDDTQHPLWNQTTSLDTLSWKSLPDELRKRNINLNMILVEPNKSFSELHSLINPETQKAWFKISNERHTVLLSSQASWAPLTVKRTSETTDPDKAAETKKARTSTPKQTPAAPPSQISAPAPPKSAESNPPPSTQSNPSAKPPTIGIAQLQNALARMRELEPQLKQVRAQMEVLRQQNRIQEMEDLQKTFQPKMQLYLRFKSFMLQAQMKSAAALSASTNSGPTQQAEPKAESTAGPSGQNQNAIPGPSNIGSSQPQQMSSAQAIQQVLQARQAQQLIRTGISGPDTRQAQNMLPQLAPNIAAQMQKLQMKEGISGLSAMPHHQVQQSHPPGNQQTQQTGNQPQNQLSGPNEIRAWLGTFSWVNPQTMSPMDVQVQMQANKIIQPALWPTTFEIELLREQAVPLQVLKEWVSRHGPVLCQIRPFPRSVDPQENMFRLKNLSATINERNIYAVGRRSPAAANNKPLMLVFSMGGEVGQLAAAVFPETGVPELPRANPNPQPVPGMRPPTVGPGSQPGLNIPPQMLAMLQNLTPEQRMQFLARIRQQQQQHIQQAQALAQSQTQIQQATAVAGRNTANASPGNPNASPSPLVNLPGGGWSGSGLPNGQNMGIPLNLPGGLNANLAQALAALQQQQQRQGGMQPRPGSGGSAPFQ